MIYIVIAGIILCVILSGFFSSSEMAYSACNTVRLENIAEDKDKGWKKAKKALRITKRFDDALSAILIGNNLVNIAASSLGSVLVILIFGSDSFTWVSTALITVLVIIFGETIPKITSKKAATLKAMNNAWLISALMIVFKPVIWIVVKTISLITLGMKGESDEDTSQEESVEELQSIIETAEDEGIIDEDDSQLMQAAIDFSEISASEVMTARVDVNAIDIDDSWEEILQVIENSPYSRIPVYEDSIDNIIGILHLNRVYRALTEHEDQQNQGQSLFSLDIRDMTPSTEQIDAPIDIRSILMPPCYVYKAMKLPKVLNTLKAAKQHLAIVTDEYSGTLGVVTMEDVLETIVGDIYDETDVIDPDVVKRNDKEFEVDGDLPISEFLELASIDEDDFEAESDTVGGWTVESFGSFPNAGDSFTFRNMTITVLSMDGLRVEKLLVKTTD